MDEPATAQRRATNFMETARRDSASASPVGAAGAARRGLALETAARRLAAGDADRMAVCVPKDSRDSDPNALQSGQEDVKKEISKVSVFSSQSKTNMPELADGDDDAA